MSSSVQISIALLEQVNAGLREHVRRAERGMRSSRRLRLDAAQASQPLWHVPLRLWRFVGTTTMVSLLLTAGGVLATFR